MSNESKYYQIAQEQLRQQLENVDGLSAKVNTLLIVCGMLIVFWNGVISEGHYLIDFGSLFVIIAMVYLLLTYRIIKWHQGPNIDRILFDLEENIPINNFYKRMVKSISVFYTKNEKLMHKKSIRINWAGRFLVVGIICATIGTIIRLFQ